MLHDIAVRASAHDPRGLPLLRPAVQGQGRTRDDPARQRLTDGFRRGQGAHAHRIRRSDAKLVDQIPEGFAHGFLVLSDKAEFCYKCTDFYSAADEGGIRYDDPTIGVEWPILEGVPLLLSEKDKKWPFLG